MKKLFTLASFIISVTTFSQITVVGTGFDNYANTSGTAPAGWYMSWHSASPASSYTTAANSGVAIPSYKFGLDSVTVITPMYQNADTLSFMCKGNGVPFADTNELHIYHSADNITWTQFVNRDSLPAAKTTLKYGLPAASGWLKFVYRKLGNGNLAFDDVNILSYPNIYAQFSNPGSICLEDSICFTDLSISNNGTINYWHWSMGDGNDFYTQNVCHTFAAYGTYTVCLAVKNTNNDADTICSSITVNPTPVANFSNDTSNQVSFLDLSFTPSGTITSWNWSFPGGSPSSSVIQNPGPITYAANGTYTACLTITNSFGCVDSMCTTIPITTVGINETDISSSINIFPAISQTGIFTIQNSQFTIQGVEVYNAVGERMSVFSGEIKSLNLSGFPAGIYFVKVLSDNYVATKKIVFSK